MTPQDELREKMPLFTPQPQAAFVLLDHHTGHVLAMRGVRGERGANRILNRATQSTRSPGSQMKPIAVFGPAFDMGIMQPGTVIDDEPFTYIDPWTGTPWTPRNHWAAGRWYGPSTVRAAVYYSMNVVSARATVDPTIPHVGIEAMFRYLRNMGITTLADGFDGAAVSLGGMHHGVRLIELAGAYGMVANEGMFNRPVLYTLVLDADGNVLLQNPVNPTRVFSETAAFLLTETMKDTLTAGRATGLAANWLNNPDLRRDIPIAGKTGTSNDRRDVGFSGSTAYYTASIWMGNDNNEPMTRGFHRAHLHAWRSIMQEIHENLPPRQFPRPADGRIIRATICMDSGMLAGELCRHDSRGSRLSTDIFDSRFVPTQTCELHVEFTYCVEYGYLAGPYCPAHVTSTRVGILKGDETFGGFPQPVLDGIICPHHSTPDLTLPWEHPDFFPPAQGEGPPITLWPDTSLPIPPMPDRPPQDDLSLPPEFDDFFEDTDEEDDPPDGL
jgi:penicillin-binding protein 1A